MSRKRPREEFGAGDDLQPTLRDASKRAGHDPADGQHVHSHNCPAVYASGNAQLQLGNNYRYYSAPTATQLAGDVISSKLFFAEMMIRYDSIEDACGETFDWILRPKSKQNPPQVVNFIEWFSGPDKTYWISGKPGSGKSTLMKHLSKNLDTIVSRSDEIWISTSFWFWEAATQPLQRNLQGCIRSLLWQLMQNRCATKAVNEVLKDKAVFAWSTKRLSDAFRDVVQSLQQKGVHLVIILDGLDESGSDADEILQLFLNSAKRSEMIKLCVSSRSEPLFLMKLSASPRVEMQHFNEEDVKKVIEQKLLCTEEFKQWCEDESTRTKYGTELERVITAGAAGVLLWVRLVIADVLKGIHRYDTFEELSQRIDKLPQELDGLYEFMLQRNGSDVADSQQEASFYCQLIAHFEMSPVTFYLATHDDVRRDWLNFSPRCDALRSNVNLKHLAVRVNSRSSGLLEVAALRDMKHGPIPDKVYSKYLELIEEDHSFRIQFIHRTARSFFLERNAEASLPDALESVAQKCFEARLVVFMLLPMSEQGRVLSLGYCHRILDQCVKCRMVQYRTRQQLFESVLTRLHHMGVLLATKAFMPTQLRAGGFLSPGTVSIPLLQTGIVHFNQIYSMCGVWKHMGLEHFALNGLEQIDMFTLFWSARSPLGVDAEPPHNNAVQVQLLKSVSPDLEFVDCYGDSISVFHRFLHLVSRPRQDTALTYYSDAESICDWLEKANDDTVCRIAGPSMTCCVEEVGSRFRSSGHSRFSILGNFSAAAFVNAFRNMFCQTFWASLTRFGGRTGSCVVVDFMVPNKEPMKLYAMTSADAEEVFRMLQCGEIAVANSSNQGWGAITFDSNHKTDQIFKNILYRSRRLHSLSEAFLFLGKSHGTIKNFGTAFEREWFAYKIISEYSGLSKPKWREFYYGSESAQVDL